MGPLYRLYSSQKRVSLMGGRLGCREREIAVIVSEVGVEGLRPVMPGVFILRKWAKSRL